MNLKPSHRHPKKYEYKDNTRLKDDIITYTPDWGSPPSALALSALLLREEKAAGSAAVGQTVPPLTVGTDERNTRLLTGIAAPNRASVPDFRPGAGKSAERFCKAARPSAG